MQNEQIAERIKIQCKKIGTTTKTILELCKINKGFIYDLEKKGKTPSVDKIIKIADCLNCSTDYLLGREEKTNYNLTNKEIEILKKWNKLDTIEQELIQEKIDTLIEVKEKKQSKLSG